MANKLFWNIIYDVGDVVRNFLGDEGAVVSFFLQCWMDIELFDGKGFPLKDGGEEQVDKKQQHDKHQQLRVERHQVLHVFVELLYGSE